MSGNGRLLGGIHPIMSPDKKSFTIKMPENMCRPPEQKFDLNKLKAKDCMKAMGIPKKRGASKWLTTLNRST